MRGVSMAEPIDLNAFRHARALRSIALSVGYAHSFDHYYQAALEFERQRMAKANRNAGVAKSKMRKLKEACRLYFTGESY